MSFAICRSQLTNSTFQTVVKNSVGVKQAKNEDGDEIKMITRSAAKRNIQQANALCRRSLRFSVDEKDNKKKDSPKQTKRTQRFTSLR